MLRAVGVGNKMASQMGESCFQEVTYYWVLLVCIISNAIK